MATEPTHSAGHDACLECRVCGFSNEAPPWGTDGKTPLFDMCPCCGVEFGYEDATALGARGYRDEWLARGAQWHDPACKPEAWDLSLQLPRVPEPFR
jgi:hypothetical protein